MRGLPVAVLDVDTNHDETVTTLQMRECLVNHLNMIALLEKQLAADQTATDRDEAALLIVDEEAMGLLTLHLAILRDHLEKEL